MASSARGELAAKIDAIEAAYEFFLAYAAQGLTRELEGSQVEIQLRRHLEAMREAAAALAGLLADVVREQEGEGATRDAPEALEAFRQVVEADAASAGAALALVHAQPFASSQLVDNLNASVHVRALLTDLFLLDEVLKLGVDEPARELDRRAQGVDEAAQGMDDAAPG